MSKWSRVSRPSYFQHAQRTQALGLGLLHKGQSYSSRQIICNSIERLLLAMCTTCPVGIGKADTDLTIRSGCFVRMTGFSIEIIQCPVCRNEGIWHVTGNKKLLSSFCAYIPSFVASSLHVTWEVLFGTLMHPLSSNIKFLENGGRPWNRTRRASPRGSYSPLPHLAACRPLPRENSKRERVITSGPYVRQAEKLLRCQVFSVEQG